MQDAKFFLVAGKIPVSFEPSKERLETSAHTLNNLISYLMSFLGRYAYIDNEPQVKKVIVKMLQNATIEHNKLYFSFPQKIRKQFRLEKRYCISLEIKSAHDFYCNVLKPKTALACSIKFENIVQADSKNISCAKMKKSALLRLQRLIHNSPYHIASIVISKDDDVYRAIINFILETQDDVVIEDTEFGTLIHKIQDAIA